MLSIYRNFHRGARNVRLARRSVVGLAVFVFFQVSMVGAAGCASSGRATAPPANETPAIQMVTTTTFLADWAREIGGDRVDVYGLVEVGSDPHGFQPGARDVTRITDADLILSVGLELEAEWLEDLINNASADESVILAVGDVVDPLPNVKDNVDADREDRSDEERHNGIYDPHFWMDPLRTQIVINDIAARLSHLDPAGADTYRANAAAYTRELDALHAWIEEKVATISEDQRLLLTSHDSLSYLADRYGFTIIGTVISGSTTTGGSPSPRHLEDLARKVDEFGVDAIFGETTVSERLAAAIAEETDAALVRLYSGSLGAEGTGASTYLGMMRTNVERIVEALT